MEMPQVINSFYLLLASALSFIPASAILLNLPFLAEWNSKRVMFQSV